jgi:hypothetical protein
MQVVIFQNVSNYINVEGQTNLDAGGVVLPD